MLETLRNGSKGWLSAVMILMLVGSFGMWGVQDMLNLSSTPKIATVAGDDIPPERFQQEFSRFLAQMSKSTNEELTSQQAKAAGLDRVALDRFVKKLSIQKIAKDMSLTISPEQIVEALKSSPGIVDKQGKLVPGALEQLARANNVSEEQFYELITGDLKREQLLRAIGADVRLPPGLATALNQFRLERRIAEYVVIDPERAGAIADPDEAALKKYYEAMAGARYSVPESRQVVFVVARPDDIAARLTIPEADILKVYNANKRRYETPEKRVLEQIRFKSEDAARAAAAKLASGETFEAAAKAAGMSADDMKYGEVSKGDKTVPGVVFDLPVLKASDPVNNAFGNWVIVRATSMTPGTLKTLEEAREEIRKAIADSKAKEELFELTNTLEDTLGGGATLEEAAKKLNLQVHTAELTSSGQDLAGAVVQGLPGGDFLTQVFAADTSTDPELQQTPEGAYYEFRVDKITKTAKKPFDEVKAQILADWKDDQISSKLKAQADSVLKRGKAGESFAAIASAMGLSVVTSDPIPRYGKTTVFSELAVSAASDARKGEFFEGPVAFGKGVVVGRVTEIMFQPETADNPARSTYLQRVQQSYVSDFIEQFENGARVKAGAKIDEARFQSFHNNE
jgi:peptidyl-prolyl cis-trans isomerase D